MVRKIILNLITAYQKISPFQSRFWQSLFPLGDICRFHPTCSQYTYQAIQRYGILKGGWLSFKRLSRCHPWSGGGLDPLD